MKFLHISDTHLGYQQYGLKERAQDFLDAFKQALEIAKEEKVEFIIHTGDLFHTKRPDNETLVQTIKLIKDTKIPIYAIEGNHDKEGHIKKSDSPLEILKEATQLQIVRSAVQVNDSISIFGVSYTSSHRLKMSSQEGKSFSKILEELYYNAKVPKEFVILMLHLEFKETLPFAFLSHQDIPPMFDYVGIGHLHDRQEPIKDGNRYIVYPGSTEYTQILEKSDIQKGVYIVEIDNSKVKNIEFKPLNTRKIIKLKINNTTVEEIEKILKEIAEKYENEEKKVILKLVLEKDENLKDYEKIILKKDIERILEQNKIKDKFLHVLKEEETIKKNKAENAIEEDSIEKMIISKEDLFKDILSKIDDSEVKDKLSQIINIVESVESEQEINQIIKDHQELFEF
ncbi:MAG: exonuclease SbcCD subunit D [Sulfurihydrogenibium sp.]|jgi:DNA repair exonuclease SbcCD nuclease subunit|nr:exonuclease SbcCD subunit D [Sulfurihydrogenibium sp.]